MLRRIHVPAVRRGEIPLDAAQVRHARDVLRLESGAMVEVFDDAGAVATGELIVSGRDVVVRISDIHDPPAPHRAFAWTIAAAVPKGERADWMVEKLSELGTAEFMPLAAARSVVLPEGKNKRDRWVRIATESAKQSRRTGVMRIGELTSVPDLLQRLTGAPPISKWYLSTAEDAQPLATLPTNPRLATPITALIGPEGGWTHEELQHFASASLTAVKLTDTILRIETAAIATAAWIATVIAPHAPG